MIYYYNCRVLRRHDCGLLDPEDSFSVIADSYEDAHAKARLIKGRLKAYSIEQSHPIGSGPALYQLKAAHL